MKVIEILSIAGFISLIYISLILTDLSKRLGSVTKLLSFYRIYYVGIFFLVIASGIYSAFVLKDTGLIDWNLPLHKEEEVNVLLLLFASTGVVINFIISIKYWGWLFKSIFWFR